MAKSTGYILVARSLRDHPLVGFEKPYSHTEAWLWLLIEAAHSDRSVTRLGKAVSIQRGQLAHSNRFMAEAFGWSEAGVRRFVARLKADSMIDADADAGITVITICNYEHYQDGMPISDAENDATDGVTHLRQKTDALCDAQTDAQTDALVDAADDAAASNVTCCDAENISARAVCDDATNDASSDAASDAPTGIATDAPKLKKRRKREPINSKINYKYNPRSFSSDAFASWYSAYPRKVDRKDAERAFAKVVEAGEVTFEVLMAATRRYAAAVRAIDPRFIKHPATWLNKGSYLDGVTIGSTPTAGVDPPSETTAITALTRSQWVTAVELFSNGGHWAAAWGPRPGEAGCLAPSDLLEMNGVKGRRVAA
jgi:hypothetical protein